VSRVEIAILAWLERRGSKRIREEMLTRYGITAPKAFGMSVSAIQQLAKRMGRDHDLAAALWETGWYEARMLAAYVDDPALVTPAQMDRWARDFDNWGICDTLCFVPRRCGAGSRHAGAPSKHDDPVIAPSFGAPGNPPGRTGVSCARPAHETFRSFT
jgi:hypothetical protein